MKTFWPPAWEGFHIPMFTSQNQNTPNSTTKPPTTWLSLLDLSYDSTTVTGLSSLMMTVRALSHSRRRGVGKVAGVEEGGRFVQSKDSTEHVGFLPVQMMIP